jgi:hypothetical protein
MAFFASKAQAELIIIQITATVDIVNDFGNYLEGKITVGSIITGSYTYESTTPDSNPDSTVGDYWHHSLPCGILLTVGGFEFKTDPTNVNFLASIGNNHSGRDVYLMRSYNNLPLSNGTLVDYISWQLDDYTETVFSSDTLPATAPILSQWQFNNLRIDRVGDYLIDAQVTNAIVIPEPATLLLLGAGIMLLRKHS